MEKTRNEIKAECGCILQKQEGIDFELRVYCGKHIDGIQNSTKEFDEFRRGLMKQYNARFNVPPNVEIKCNLCGDVIIVHCMLSPDFSLADSLHGSVLALRKHFDKNHGFKNPDDKHTMCGYCHVISEFDQSRNMWLGCKHKPGQTKENQF